MSSESKKLATFLRVMDEYMLELYKSEAARQPAAQASVDSFKKHRINWDECTLTELRESLGDSLEGMKHLPSKDTEKLDTKLIQLDAPSLSDMLNKDSKRVLRILGKNRISNEDEWRCLERTLSDTSSTLLNSSEKLKADKLLTEYVPT